jgi:ribose transport system ATP-binding protein
LIEHSSTGAGVRSEKAVPALDIRGLSKSFAGTLALAGVDLRIESGEVHGLVGPNGSGKSTLVKILAGYHQADRVERIAVGGQVLSSHFSSLDIQRHGVGFVHQDLALVEQCSVSDNLAFGVRGYATGVAGRVVWRRHRDAVRDALKRVHLDIDPERTVASLAPAERTLVAIARALSQFEHAHLLVLDEPTARLPHGDADFLLDTVRRIVAQGTSILYITHRMSELFSIAQRLTVIKDGRNVVALETAAVTSQQITNLMIGEGRTAHHRRAAVTRKTGLSKDASTAAEFVDVSTDRMRNISFTLKRGQVLALTGAIGSGVEDCGSVLYGLKRPLSGRVRIAGGEVEAITIDGARRAGIAYLPADRPTQGAFLDNTTAENILIADLKPVTRGLRIDGATARRDAEGVVRDMAVHPADPNYVFRGLSGGNQQKALFGKWLRVKPRVLILNEPTQGVDVVSRYEIYARIEKAKADGLAVLWITSDLEESLEIADTIGVFFKGQLDLLLDRADANLAGISRSAMGLH